MPSDTQNPCDVIASLLSANGLARQLCVSRRTIARLKSAGKLPRALRIGGSVRWRSEDIAQWIEAGCPDRQEWEAISKQRKGA